MSNYYSKHYSGFSNLSYCIYYVVSIDRERNRRVAFSLSKKNVSRSTFIKNFACFAGKKYTLLHETVLGGVLFSKVAKTNLHILSISISIILFIIIIKHLQHKASKAIEKTVCSKLHNRFCRCFKINDLACAGCAVF